MSFHPVVQLARSRDGFLGECLAHCVRRHYPRARVSTPSPDNNALLLLADTDLTAGMHQDLAAHEDAVGRRRI